MPIQRRMTNEQNQKILFLTQYCKSVPRSYHLLFCQKNYVPAERMCTLPTLCGIGAGLLLANLNFNGIEKEFADPLIWRIAFSVAGINAFFHFHRVWKMPTATWKTAYFLYCWAISLNAFFIWVILVSLAILLAVIIFVLLALGCAITSPS